MNNIKDQLDQRQLVYSIFALFYRGELIKGLDVLYNTYFLQKLSNFSNNTTLKSITNKIINEIENNKTNSNYVKLLLDDYQRLFVGPNHILAPLWESVYCTKYKLIFDENELKVRKLYNKSGLDVRKTEPADHLSLELAFMARMCSTGNDIVTIESEESLLKELKFLNEHLLKWTSSWVKKVNEYAVTEFWKNFSLITRSWLENDFNELDKIVNKSVVDNKIRVVIK